MNKRTVGAGAKRQKGKPQPAANSEDWVELVDIIVSFGYAGEEGDRRLITKAYHSQRDREARWEGIAREELLDWILEEARSFLPPDAAST